MEMKKMAEKILLVLKKYRYPILVLIIGIVLMTIPSFNDNTQKAAELKVDKAATEPSLEAKLATILSKVEGAGDVQVILTVAAGEETVYQLNEDKITGTETDSVKLDVVTITDSQRNQTGLIRQVNPAIYQGAIIVCQGADVPSVALELVNAVSKLTGLGTNRISVLKMK